MIVRSRTDAGVHALHTTVHVDLQKPRGRIISAKHVTAALNRSFDKCCLPISILNTETVSPAFHCRFDVKERKYLYRLAIAKQHYQPSEEENRNTAFHSKFKPVEELNRCLFLLLDKVNDSIVRR